MSDNKEELLDRINVLEWALQSCGRYAQEILDRGYCESMHADYIIDEAKEVLGEDYI